MFDAVTTSRKCPACGRVDDTLHTMAKLKELEDALHHKNRALCHSCGAALKFGNTKAGTIAKCPQCGAKVVVPQKADEWGAVRTMLKVIGVIAFCLMALMIKTCVKAGADKANKRALEVTEKVAP